VLQYLASRAEVGDKYADLQGLVERSGISELRWHETLCRAHRAGLLKVSYELRCPNCDADVFALSSKHLATATYACDVCGERFLATIDDISTVYAITRAGIVAYRRMFRKPYPRLVAAGLREPVSNRAGEIWEMVTVDDIESFERVRRISSQQVAAWVPVRLSERHIKEGLASILGERFVPLGWGGEPSDLFSSRLSLRGRRYTAAFLLKGPAKKGPLTIEKCGKRGNQILRLVKEPANVFIVQHVDEVSQDVFELLEIAVAYKSLRGEKLFYCILDGTDTARVLFAYGILGPTVSHSK